MGFTHIGAQWIQLTLAVFLLSTLRQ